MQNPNYGLNVTFDRSIFHISPMSDRLIPAYHIEQNRTNFTSNSIELNGTKEFDKVQLR